MTLLYKQPKREFVRLVSCPQCGAQPGERCIATTKGNRRRLSNHDARVQAYLVTAGLI